MTEGKRVELLHDRRGIYGIGVRILSPSLGARPPPSPLRLPPPPARVTAALYQSVRPCGGYRERVRGYCRDARHERPRRREGLVQLQVKRRT